MAKKKQVTQASEATEGGSFYWINPVHLANIGTVSGECTERDLAAFKRATAKVKGFELSKYVGQK